MKRFSVSVRLLAMLAVAALAVEGAALVVSAADQADKIVIDGSTTVGPIAKAFAEYYMALHPKVNITVNESGSSNGAKSLVSGKCDVATMSRFMKETEFQAAVTNGVMPVAHVAAMDGIAMIVHPSNPIVTKGLTVEQVKAIYEGKISNWKELGGPDKEIHRVSRDTSSGTFECFEGLVMKKAPIASGTETVGSNAAARERVRSTPHAIAYVGLGFVDDTVRALVVDNVECNEDTVSSGQYPISRPLFMFTNGYPKLGSHVHAFVTLYLTPKGQEIVKTIGFVPLTKY